VRAPFWLRRAIGGNNLAGMKYSEGLGRPRESLLVTNAILEASCRGCLRLWWCQSPRKSVVGVMAGTVVTRYLGWDAKLAKG
jgi:hypothetical protein